MKYDKHDKYLEITCGVIPLNIRPHIYDFLDYCLEYFEMAIYTASCSDYADPILDYIEQIGGKKYFKYRFYREHCIYYKSLFIKDLSIFGKPMDQIIIVDNCLFSFAHYLDNGVLITSFYEDEEDLDLLSIIEFFKSSILDTDSTDVREVIKNTFEFSNIFSNLKNIEFNSN
jgi:CTD small phosphatase-like protein 2